MAKSVTTEKSLIVYLYGLELERDAVDEQAVLDMWDSLENRVGYVYCLVFDGEVYYIGSTGSIKNRAMSHPLRRAGAKLFYFETKDHANFEKALIARHKPRFNLQTYDDHLSESISLDMFKLTEHCQYKSDGKKYLELSNCTK